MKTHGNTMKKQFVLLFGTIYFWLWILTKLHGVDAQSLCGASSTMGEHRYNKAKDGSYRAKKQQKTETSGFSQKLFFHYFKWNWWGLGVSRATALTVRRHRHKSPRDLVVHGIRKSTFLKYWNFHVLEMAIKTFQFVQGLSRTHLLFSTWYLTNISSGRYF